MKHPTDNEIAQARAKVGKEKADQIERANDNAHSFIMNTVLPFIYQQEDPGTAAYALWAEMVHMLAHGGWTVAELARDLQWHVENEQPWIRSTLSLTTGKA